MKSDRRTFLKQTSCGLASKSPWLGLLGFRVHKYANPIATGWHGWVTWCGKLVGFVRLVRG